MSEQLPKRRGAHQRPPSLEHPAEPAETETETDAGSECPVCGRRGRAEGHH